MSAGISEDEIERELQTLRNLRRRSASSPGPGALAVDPDLPPPSPSPSASSTAYTSNDDVTLATPDGLDDDGSLFWVPAHLHPELAPGEFKAFLKAHTSADPEDADGDDTGAAPGLARSGSWLNRRGSGRRAGGDGLGRKRSMLSKQYQPRAGDAIEEEVPPVPTRNGRGSIYRGRGGEKGLTLQDLQRLETMVDSVEEGSDDPTQMRTMLRRSLSMNVAPGFLQDDVAQGDEENQAVVTPRPGSIIRRTARTRIRKAHLSGDGGGRRFPASRRPRQDGEDARQASDGDDGEGSEEHYNPLERFERPESGEGYEYEERYQDALEHQSSSRRLEDRRASDETTDEGVIFDAYRSSRTSSLSSESGDRSMSASPDSSPPQNRKLSLPPITPGYHGREQWDSGEKTPTQESVNDPMSRQFSSPSPENSEEGAPRTGMRKVSGMKLEVPPAFDTPRPRPISPTSPQATQRPAAAEYELPPGMAPPVTRQSVPPGLALQHQKSQESLGPSPIDARPPLTRPDSSASLSSTVASSSSSVKEKKSGFFGKKDKKEKEKKKEKEGFLGSLFGGKKKHEEVVTVSNFGTAGPAAAAALLGSSKSAKSMGHSPAPSPTTPGFQTNGAGNFARYPIHVERAVYRLSHIKLANARRPLYEQVLISNLMFWYLGVIGRNVSEEKKADKEEKKEVEPAKPPPAKGTPPKSLEGGQAGNGLPIHREKEISVPPPQVVQAAPPQSTLKKGLTKPERRRDGRDAEAAVRTPSYGMQNALVDSDLRAREARENRDSRDSRDSGLKPQAGARGMNGSPSPPPQQQPYQNYGPPPGGHPARSPSIPNLAPPDSRRQGPPSPNMQQHTRPASDHGHSAPIPREVQGLPRGVPQSSFGPPPPPNAGFDPARDPRQRTLSTPSPVHGQGPPMGGPGPAGQMRRVVTEGRPEQMGSPPPGSRPMHPSHSGPQPGQIFQYPGSVSPHSPTGLGPPGSSQPQPPFPSRASSHPAPGQLFSPPPGAGPLPGQVFHRPPPNGQGYPHPGPRPGPPPEMWAGPQRLPPPQPGQPMPYPPQQQQQYQARPDFAHPQPQVPYDPRRALPGPPQNGQYPPARPQAYPPRPPQLGAPVGGYGAYPHPPNGPGPQPGQSEYRRSQAVPGQYGHHR
ncbi:uncharacterized protein MKK02DRAFT_45695 [Dioszegia hungarica]|uniref:Protein Zds1 C-terminal domain-containing protein n=1 Tax=Dioszegia hungarica TaxID=4972 RepID=A0AA38HDU1_9TREE|nr:uncharacterized protein MKK02DRAFT_45695 [Dioszegia hungarica]KAI9636986.1 hypothetical protein MKK02DRAFT_45695 [Dioszegia hungarica]